LTLNVAHNDDLPNRRGGYSADPQSQQETGRLCRSMVFDLLRGALNEANQPFRVVDRNLSMNAHTFQAAVRGMDKSASIMIGHSPVPPLLMPMSLRAGLPSHVDQDWTPGKAD
jgi:hypothetical protein